jgi:hypothetical protein
MVALLFTAVFIIGFLAISLLFWAARTKAPGKALLPPPDPPRGLFTENDGFESAVSPPADSSKSESERKLLNERAGTGDQSALVEAQALGDRKFYDDVLDRLTVKADRGPTLLALASFVTRHELPVNRKLAEALISSWKSSPDRSSTATSLHFAALADDADLYQNTVEAALQFWRQGLIANVSAAELKALFDGEFWVLSTRTRSSGAGFILKRKLASARRELETAMRVN